MTSLAPDAPDVTSFEAAVTAIDDTAVELEETYFYPEGGGQPADRGFIDGVPVVDVQSEGGTVRHHLEATPSFEVGDSVTGSIDPDFRTYCRRAHTASHALFGAGRRLLDDVSYGGFDIDERRARLDLVTSTEIEDDLLVALERLVNRTVWDGRPVTWQELSKDEALSRPDIAFNAGTADGLGDGESVRVVEIEDWDVAACGGTHVENTREIGPVSLLDRSNPGQGRTRITLAVGPPSILQRASEHRASRAAARQLDVSVTDVDAAVSELVAERDRLQEEVADLRDQVIAARLSDLEDATVRRDGTEWLVGTLPSGDVNALEELAERLSAQAADVVVLVGTDGSYLAVASRGEPAATAVVKAITDSYGGNGGGSATVAQAGGLDADPSALVAELRRSPPGDI